MWQWNLQNYFVFSINSFLPRFLYVERPAIEKKTYSPIKPTEKDTINKQQQKLDKCMS